MQKIIYSLRIFLKLNKKGFVPIATMPNPNNSKLMCWVFKKTPKFEKELNKILEE